MYFSENWESELNRIVGLPFFEDAACVDRVWRDLGLFRNVHEKYELQYSPILEGFPLAVIETDDLKIMPLHIRVRVYKMNGDVVIDEMQEGDAHVEDLKLRIRDIAHIQLYEQHLSVHTRELPLLDTEMLRELHAPTSSQSGTLEIQLLIVSEQMGRGPFGLGQIAEWGAWEGMSNCSGILDNYQGSWTCLMECRPHLRNAFHDMRGFVIKINADSAIDYYGNPLMLSVTEGHVHLMGMRTSMNSDGDLILVGRLVQTGGRLQLVYRRSERILKGSVVFR